MDPSFIRGYQASVRQEPIVFGLPLKPLTLGHVFLLESLDSPLVRGGSEISFADMGAAVFACANEPERARRYFAAWWFPLFTRFWGWRAQAHWIARDLPAFREYLQDGFGSPSLRPVQRDGGRVCKVPGPWLKLFFAMHVLHMTREQAMRMTVIELNILYATWAEWNGSGEVIDSEAISDLWAYAEEQERIKKEANGSL